MKKYVIFYRYDRGETYEVYYVGSNLRESKKEFKKQLVSFYSYGPDDVSQLWFVRFKNLTQDMVDKLTSNDEEVSSGMIRLLCMGEKYIYDFDSFGWDRNESIYYDDEVCVCYGPDGMETLVDLVEDGTIVIDGCDPEEDDVWETISNLDSLDFEKLIKKYCLLF